MKVKHQNMVIFSVIRATFTWGSQPSTVGISSARWVRLDGIGSQMRVDRSGLVLHWCQWSFGSDDRVSVWNPRNFRISMLFWPEGAWNSHIHATECMAHDLDSATFIGDCLICEEILLSKHHSAAQGSRDMSISSSLKTPSTTCSWGHQQDQSDSTQWWPQELVGVHLNVWRFPNSWGTQNHPSHCIDHDLASKQP